MIVHIVILDNKNGYRFIFQKEFSTNPKKETSSSSEKKAKDKASNNSAKDKNDEGTKKGRSLRSGDVDTAPGRLTRSRNTSNKK